MAMQGFRIWITSHKSTSLPSFLIHRATWAGIETVRRCRRAIFVSSPSKLAFTFKDGKNARWSMNGIEGRGVRKGLKSLEAHGRRCNSQKLSATTNDLNHTEGPSIHQKIHNRYHISAVHEPANEFKAKADHSDALWTIALKKLDAFSRFTRPYAAVTTIVAIISMSLLPIERMADLSPLFFLGLLKTLLAALFMHFYVVGVNEVFDVEIDKINKPSLPLASGELSVEEGIIITVAFCIVSLFMGLKSHSPPLLYALLTWFLAGSAYSINLPLLRWKQHPFLAGLFHVLIGGIVLHIPFFVHIQKYVLRRPVVLTKSVVFATAFTSVFSAAIAFLKDIPDIDGDKSAGIQTLCVRLGPERALWLGTKALLAAYGTAMLVGAASSNVYCGLITVLGHGLLASILWFCAKSVDIHNKTSTQSFYMLIWKLLTAEYFLIPFVR